MPRQQLQRQLLTLSVLILCLGFAGCEYTVPITSTPTRKIDERLLGKWYASDGEPTTVEKADDFSYLIKSGDSKLRAYHSDVKSVSFLSVLVVDGKYSYVTYKLEENGIVLRGQHVSVEVIPVKLRDSATVQKLIEENLQNPKLLKGGFVLTRAPVSKKQLINALKQLRRGDSQMDIVNEVRIRGVDFEITPAVKTELRSAGARPELIAASRDNFDRPPEITSFLASASNIARPCPPGEMSTTCQPSNAKVQLTTNASDPDGDKLLYSYQVTGGRIVGEGPNVMWDLAGAASGMYTATVEVGGGRGRVSKSTSVAVDVCIGCLRPRN